MVTQAGTIKWKCAVINLSDPTNIAYIKLYINDELVDRAWAIPSDVDALRSPKPQTIEEIREQIKQLKELLVNQTRMW